MQASVRKRLGSNRSVFTKVQAIVWRFHKQFSNMKALFRPRRGILDRQLLPTRHLEVIIFISDLMISHDFCMSVMDFGMFSGPASLKIR